MRQNHRQDNLKFVTRYWKANAFNPEKGIRALGLGRIRIFRRTLTAVAAAALIICSTFAIRYMLTTSGSDSGIIIIAATSRNIGLPDGSTLTLWPGSAVTYDPATFLTDRHLTLNGKARFEVEHNPDYPFSVTQGITEVTVLGTIFTITPGSTGETVSVERGRVRVVNSGRSTELTAGMTASVTDTGIKVSDIYPDKAEFIFTDTPMATIIGNIETRFGIKIKGDYDPASRVTFRLTGTPEEIIEAINELESVSLTISQRATSKN